MENGGKERVYGGIITKGGKRRLYVSLWKDGLPPNIEEYKGHRLVGENENVLKAFGEDDATEYWTL